MEALYHQSQQLMVDIQHTLPHIERSSGRQASEIDQSIREKLEQITRWVLMQYHLPLTVPWL